MIIPDAKPGQTYVPDASENVKPIVSPEVNAPPVVTNNSLSAKNRVVNNPNNIINRGVNTVNPAFTAGMKPMNVNQNSRLALAGNDPLLQAIAMKDRRAV